MFDPVAMDTLQDELVESICRLLDPQSLHTFHNTCSRARRLALQTVTSLKLSLKPDSALEAGRATFSTHEAPCKPMRVTLVGDVDSEEELSRGIGIDDDCKMCGKNPPADSFSLAAMIAAANATPASLRGRVEHLRLQNLRLCSICPLLHEWCVGKSDSNTINSLELDACVLQGQALQHLVALPSQRLSIDSPFLCNDVAIPLDNLHTSLTHLTLRRGNTLQAVLRCTDVGYSPLTALKSLSHLDLSQYSMAGAVLETSHLAALTSLTSLSLNAGVGSLDEDLVDWSEGECWLPEALPPLPMLQSFSLAISDLPFTEDTFDLDRFMPSIGLQTQLTQLSMFWPATCGHYLTRTELSPVVNGCKSLVKLELGPVSGHGFVLLIRQLPCLQHLNIGGLVSGLPEDLSQSAFPCLETLQFEHLNLPCRGGCGLARLPLSSLKRPLQITSFVRPCPYAPFVDQSGVPELGETLSAQEQLDAARTDVQALLSHLQHHGVSGHCMDVSLSTLFWFFEGEGTISPTTLISSLGSLAPVMRRLKLSVDEKAHMSDIAASELGQVADWLVVSWRGLDTLGSTPFPKVRIVEVVVDSDELSGATARLLHIEDTLDKYIVFQAVKSALECNPLIAHVILDMTEVYRKAAALGELAIPNDRRGLQKRELKIGEHTVILWFGMSVSLMVQEDVFIKATGLSAVGV